jgi:hypothetical protein
MTRTEPRMHLHRSTDRAEERHASNAREHMRPVRLRATGPEQDSSTEDLKARIEYCRIRRLVKRDLGERLAFGGPKLANTACVQPELDP